MEKIEVKINPDQKLRGSVMSVDMSMHGYGDRRATIYLQDVESIHCERIEIEPKPVPAPVKRMQYALKIAGQMVLTTFDAKQAGKKHAALIRVARMAQKLGAKFTVEFDATPIEC